MRPTPTAGWLIACVTAALPLAGATAAPVPKLPGPGAAFALDLWNTAVHNADLSELAALTKLTALGLGWTPVTDDGLKELTPLKRLTFIDLSATKVADAGVAELQKVLPDCHIGR